MFRNRRGLAALLLLALATLPLAADATQAAAQAAPAQAGQPAQPDASLPPAREVIDRHLEAIGGREAVLAHSSSHAIGTIEVPAAGLKGTLEVFAAKPDKSLMRATLTGVGEIQEGYNGTVGWSISAMTGPTLLQGKQLEQRKFDSDFYSELRQGDRYESLTVVEKATFDGRRCYKVRLVRRSGDEDFQFFDVSTGLKAGSITTRESPMGAVTGTTVETDYKRFGTLLQPTRFTQTVMGIQQVLTITTVEFDRVDPTVFEPPAQIKAMIK